MQPTCCLNLSKVLKKTSLLLGLTTVLAYSSNSYLPNWHYNNKEEEEQIPGNLFCTDLMCDVSQSFNSNSESESAASVNVVNLQVIC